MTQEVNISRRLYSLVALRGFVMFWIIGFGYIIEGYSSDITSAFWLFIHSQGTHKICNGFTFWNLIFPLFMFMAGAAITYTTGRSLVKELTRKQLMVKAFKRDVILIIPGIIFNNRRQLLPVSEIRLPGVLGEIGASYALACISYLYSYRRAQWIFLKV
ncbi:MAG: DUF5009 domain-containing protein [Chitinophagaceae bacterium]|nr:DUF5009 domain-containing protein [Chitinophagaceae bacterium]